MIRVSTWAFAAALALASASPAAAAASDDDVVVYTVERGDTLYDLAGAYLLRQDDYRVVQRMNRIANPKRLRVGFPLRVPVRLLRTTPIEVRLSAYRGAVQITGGGKALPLVIGMSLAQGVVIATGANAFARLEMTDGSYMAIPSQSRIRIERLQRVLMTGALQRALVVEAGRGESNVAPLKTPQDSYIVRTPLSVSAVRGTEFNVHYDAEQQHAATEVLAGTVMVSSADTPPTAVPAGFGSGSDLGGGGPVTALLPPPSLLQADRAFDEASLNLDIAPLAQARAYRVRLAADAGFIDMLGETTTEDSHARFDGLGDGAYFIKLSAIDENRLEGRPATYAIDRTLNTLSLSPPTIATGDRARRFVFRWQAAGEGTRNYRFQLYRGDSPQPMIDQMALSTPEITVTDLQRGVYSWRVMSRTIRGGRRIDKWSPPELFRFDG